MEMMRAPPNHARHAMGMTSRRRVLSLLPLAPILASARRRTAQASSPSRPARIQAVAFDLLTIFDPRSVSTLAESIVPGRGKALVEAWHSRQFEYSWLRAAAASYRDFRAVTEESLAYATHSLSLAMTPQIRDKLLRAHEELALWPDARAALETMNKLGLRLAPLTNYAPSMVENLVHRAGLGSLFQELISTDRVGAFGVPRHRIAYAAFGGWDAAGAKWFGFPTFWVNRLGAAAEALTPGPDATGRTLQDLVSWVSNA
jgi:2-haloacid dehalogenase